MNYVSLYNHSEYSISDSTLRIKNLVKLAQENNLSALALTDLNNVFAAVKFYKAARAAGIKAIIGCDLTVFDGENKFQLVLLAQNISGLRNLNRLISFIYNEQLEALPIEQLSLVNCQDLIALAPSDKSDLAIFLQQNKIQDAENRILHWQKVFADRYYFLASNYGRAEESACFQAFHNWGNKFKIATAAANLACFPKAEDFQLHEIRVCISNSEVLSDKNRPQRYTPQHRFLNNQELEALFPAQLLKNSALIAERCNLELELGKNYLPDFYAPDGLSNDEYLEKKSYEGLLERFAEINLAEEEKDFYWKRLNDEINIIKKMGFAGYFLIVSDFIGWAKSQAIPVGPGRGSGAGSLVAYALKITDLNPIPYDLLFERFLNPERVSMPDFDIDFCMDRRDEVINYVADKYGRNRVAQIATHGTMAAKAVLRDVTRALGLPHSLGDKLSKSVPKALGITLSDALGISEKVKNPEFYDLISASLKSEYQENEESRQIIDFSLKLEGLVRSVGTHAGGVVIAPTDICDFSALYRDKAEGMPTSQFDKDDIESIGLVKFDFLGLRTLTIIDNAVKNIEKRLGSALDLKQIPLDDEKSFALLKSGMTTAVFQLESHGIKRLAKNLKADNFEDIVSLVALYRPGPLKAGMVDDFVKRKHGADISYPHPDLEGILNSTYGVVVYQEQVMQVAQALANYTLGAADELRRAMGKKKASEMSRHRDIFINGAKNNNVSAELAGSIFDMMASFAEYGFNKSHSAAYALLTYQTAWLKVHFPADFMAAVLSADSENTEKVVHGIEECRNLKLEIISPDVNRSFYEFTVADEKSIIFGLGAVKGMGKAAVELIVEEREKNGYFKSLEDLCKRLDSKKITRKTLELLIYSGALDCIDKNRGALFALLPQAIRLGQQYQENQLHQQNDLFGFSTNDSSKEILVLNSAENWEQRELLQHEKKVLGLYLSAHPLQIYEDKLQALKLKTLNSCLSEIEENDRNQKDIYEFKVAVLLESKLKIIKKNKERIILKFEDSGGQIEALWFGNDEGNDFPKENDLLICEFKVRYSDFIQAWQWSLQKYYPIESAFIELAKGLKIKILQNKFNNYPWKLQQILRPAPESQGLKINLHIIDNELALEALLKLPNRYYIDALCLQELQLEFGADAIKINYQEDL